MKQATRLSIDVGGTFTDVVLEHLVGQDCFKLLTTPDAPEVAFLQGVGTILERNDVVAEDVDLVIHGTTLATNALIERKGAQTALLTTGGFRDSIEIAYEHRFERVLFPARGRDGGGAGAIGRLRLASGHQLRSKGFQTIPAGERLIVEMPGGGGFGDPKAWNKISVSEDVRLGLVSSEAAARDYGVVVRDDGQIDHLGTSRRRGT